MNYGVVLPIWQLTVADAESLTTRAEELGLDGVFVPDHILAKPATTQHYGGHWPDPFSLLAYLAGRTQRIHLGASVIVLPYRNALVAAKAAATVDQVSGGRFIFGVGVGWDEAEFQDLRLPFRERGKLSDDYIRAIKAAWASDVPEYSGPYVSFAGATFSPRPAQQPHPPIWVGGSRGEAGRRLKPDLLDGLGVDRRAHGARDGQRRGHEHELVDAVGRAVGAERLEVEDLADQQAHVDHHHQVERLEGVRQLVGPHLGAPRVGRDAGDRFLVEPRRGVERQPRRIARRKRAPALLAHPPADVARPDQDDVAGLDRHPLLCRARLEILDVDGLARPHRVHALEARHVEQHAAARDPVFVVLDAVLGRTVRADQRGVAAPVHLAVVEDVAEAVPLRAALQEHGDLIFGEAPAVGQRVGAGQLLTAGDVIGARRHHAVQWIDPAERARLRAARVEVECAGDDLALTHEAGRALDHGGRDEVQRADPVVLPPPVPVAEPLAVLLEQRRGDGGALRHRYVPWPAAWMPAPVT